MGNTHHIPKDSALWRSNDKLVSIKSEGLRKRKLVFFWPKYELPRDREFVCILQHYPPARATWQKGGKVGRNLLCSDLYEIIPGP
jgi:hypothetical protein